LRIKGHSFQQIGDILGISWQRANQLVTLALKHIRNESEDLAGELRQMEMMRLDDIQGRLIGLIDRAEQRMDQADKDNQREGGDDDGGYVTYGGEQLMLQTMDRILKVVERRAKIAGLERVETGDPANDPWVSVIQSIMNRASNALAATNGDGHHSEAIPATAIPVVGPSSGGGPGDVSNRRSDEREDPTTSRRRPDSEAEYRVAEAKPSRKARKARKEDS